MLIKYSVLLFTLILLSLTNCSETYNYAEQGEASYYANLFIGRKTASGDVFFQDSLTAAHKTLPFGTQVLVTNLVNGKTIEVIVNDRGPFVSDRIIDLTRRAADSLGFLRDGTAEVILQANVSEEFLLTLDDN